MTQEGKMKEANADATLFAIRPARGESDMMVVRRLFTAYLRELAVDLSFQSVEAELQALPGPYAEPHGVILFACLDSEPCGVVALKPLPGGGEGVCEMKRLWLAPIARKGGHGARLVSRLEAEARARGYRLMKLDTLARLHAANALYERLGYRPCAAYNDNPYPDIRYFEKEL